MLRQVAYMSRDRMRPGAGGYARIDVEGEAQNCWSRELPYSPVPGLRWEAYRCLLKRYRQSHMTQRRSANGRYK